MNNVHTNPPSIGFVSTYPPTACGLATFTAALRAGMAENRASEDGLGVISVGEDRFTVPRREVEFQHRNGDPTSLREAAAALNRHDLALFQHEYGIFGGQDGAEILDMMDRLDIPSLVTLHTVLAEPSPGQKEILEKVVEGSRGVVVMSETAMSRLTSRYQVDPAKVHMIPHGANPGLARPTLTRGSRPTVITWGLIGPGKGLETAIEAFAELKDLRPLPRYLILGETHPKVRSTQGDSYLDGLKARARSLGLDDVVEFDSRYLDLATLIGTVRQADIALLPYESTEQVTSGVLVEAVAAGKPVVATRFPHAVEMLSGGAGSLVPHGDVAAIGQALRDLLTIPGLATEMARAATVTGAALHWPVVAKQYESMAASLAGRSDEIAALPLHRGGDELARVG